MNSKMSAVPVQYEQAQFLDFATKVVAEVLALRDIDEMLEGSPEEIVRLGVGAKEFQVAFITMVANRATSMMNVENSGVWTFGNLDELYPNIHQMLRNHGMASDITWRQSRFTMFIWCRDGTASYQLIARGVPRGVRSFGIS